MDIQQINKWQAAFSRYRHENFLSLLYHSAIFNYLPIAIWRLPYHNQSQAVIDLSGSHKSVQSHLDGLPAGFVITPFANHIKESACLIEAHLFWNGSECVLAPELENASSLMGNGEQFVATFEESNGRYNNGSNGKRQNSSNWFDGHVLLPDLETTKEQYCQSVENALEEIRSARLTKVVLARRLKLDLLPEFEPFILFQRLCQNYANAFVSLVAVPELGTWIGASPELLLSLADNELVTVSLAGTQTPSVNSSLTWGDKELEEQAIVSDYIRDCFLAQGITEFTETGPETMKIGELQHLRTRFSFKMTGANGMPSTNKLLAALHPTPAVCGVPKAAALEFIREMEPYDREFYAGYLGPVNLHAQTHLFVHLRCLQLQRNSAILYAGAGITKDSIPEKEWLETELKLNSLQRFLNGDAISESGMRKVGERELCG